jgi:hypothetical protein
MKHVAATVSAAVLIVISATGASGRPALTPKKQAIVEHQFASPAGAAPPAPKNRAYVPPFDPPRPQVELASVSATDVQAPVSPVLFRPTTQWVDVVGGVQTVLYAGSVPHRGGAGAIYVWITDLKTGRDLPGTGMFIADGEAGPFALTSVSGARVTFISPHGAGVFDLASREFRPGVP